MKSRRIHREQQTVNAMITMYCRNVHHSRSMLCESCGQLLDYAGDRTAKCRFGTGKPVCAKCPVHCYKPEMRIRIREVMRYSGPRMTIEHPYLALRHLVDKVQGKNGKMVSPKARWNDGVRDIVS